MTHVKSLAPRAPPRPAFMGAECAMRIAADQISPKSRMATAIGQQGRRSSEVRLDRPSIAARNLSQQHRPTARCAPRDRVRTASGARCALGASVNPSRLLLRRLPSARGTGRIKGELCMNAAAASPRAPLAKGKRRTRPSNLGFSVRVKLLDALSRRKSVIRQSPGRFFSLF